MKNIKLVLMALLLSAATGVQAQYYTNAISSDDFTGSNPVGGTVTGGWTATLGAESNLRYIDSTLSWGTQARVTAADAALYKNTTAAVGAGETLILQARIRSDNDKTMTIALGADADLTAPVAGTFSQGDALAGFYIVGGNLAFVHPNADNTGTEQEFLLASLNYGYYEVRAEIDTTAGTADVFYRLGANNTANGNVWYTETWQSLLGVDLNWNEVGYADINSAWISGQSDSGSVLDYTVSTVEATAPSSWLVYAGTNGLVYADYANEGQSNAVNSVPDFSNAGYRGGGVSIPFIPAAVYVTNGPGDDRGLIQNAIYAVNALPVNADGFRGAVVLAAGEYTVSGPLYFLKSGVVIRGAGSQEVGGTRITYTATTQSTLFKVNSGGSGPTEVSGTRQSIVDAYVPVGTKSFLVANASGFSVGDEIIVRNTMNQQWIDDLVMDMPGPNEAWTTDLFQLKFRRSIIAVDGNLVTIDAPIVQAIETRYGGGVIYKYVYTTELENIGFEGLRLESTYVSETDENHGWTAIEIYRLKNGWVRQVTGRYFGYGLTFIDQNCRQITVEDCAMLDPKSITTGGRKYSFYIDDSECILMQRCFTRGGRHDFASGSVTPGPNVFVDCRANETYADIGPHYRYATGELYDNIMGGEFAVQNRYDYGTGHGWSGAQIMFWNCEATSIICDAPIGGMNWCVGSTGVKSEGVVVPGEPFGIWDSHNSPVLPRSLYYAQLAERLGAYALNSAILPEQKAGEIWTQLNSWDGDGLFLDGLVVWLDEETLPKPYSPAAIRGVVRNLQMLDNGIVGSWSKVSGPGTVSFADSAALETTASFNQPGSYVLQLTVDDGTTVESKTLAVDVSPSPDTDADGLWDSWETTFFGSLTVSDGLPSDDYDEDGFEDLHEYLAGTNPTNQALLLKFTSAEPIAAPPGLVLTWQAVADRNYRMMESTNLVEQAWTTNATNIAGVEPLCTRTVLVENASTYYRVELE